MQAWETADKGASLPVLHSIKRVLMGEMGMTLSQAMEAPFKGAMSDCVCFSSASNKAGIITDEERKYMESKGAKKNG